MVLCHISSNKDLGARVANGLSLRDHGVLLQEKKWLDLPKLLDVWAIYSYANEKLIRLLVKTAFSFNAQPWLHDTMTTVISHFLGIAHIMHERCSSSLEVLFSPRKPGQRSAAWLQADLLEVMNFINDAIVSMKAFVSAYKPIAVFLSCPFDISSGNEMEECQNIILSLKMLCMRSVKFVMLQEQGRKVLYYTVFTFKLAEIINESSVYDVGEQSLLSLLVLLMGLHKKESVENFVETSGCNLSALIENLLKKSVEIDNRCITKLWQLAPKVGTELLLNFVANSNEPSLVKQVWEELIYGLIRGGNFPLGAIKKLTNFYKHNNKKLQVSETEERREYGLNFFSIIFPLSPYIYFNLEDKVDIKRKKMLGIY